MNLFRTAALVAIATSVAIAVDYSGHAAAYCAQVGCSAVRRSVSFGGYNPLPWVGISAYGTLFLLSLPSSARLRLRLLVPLAILGGISGAAFIASQPLLIKAWCSPCLVVDTAAIVAALSAFAFARATRVPATPSEHRPTVSPEELRHALATRESMRRWAWLTLLSMSVAAPILWPTLRPRPAPPPEIRALGTPDKVTVVEFSDFECPFCRELHPRLVDLLAAYGDRVHHVELNTPLASHPHARDAARAAICADLQSRGRQMADALFRAPLLSAGANRDLARQLGLGLTEFDRCLADPVVETRLRAERSVLDAVGLEGLPTLFIGPTKLVGAQPTEILRKELDRALRPGRNAHVPGPLFVGLLALVVATVVALGLPRRRGRPMVGASRTSAS
jgi:predicted DsbA family dithiol-disulfide isomerase